MVDIIEEDLLEFAVGLYAIEAVKRESLELQETTGASINIILWLCWLDGKKIYVDNSALTTALDIVGGVNQELLDHLRAARSRLVQASTFTKVQDKLISKSILSAELSIEKILLQRLQDLTSRLDQVEKDQEPLSLFDYLDTLELVESGATSAELLDHSRNYVVVQRELA